MNKNLSIAPRGLIGFIAGGAAGGFLGLIIGGTFLGWINFHELIGMEGYELTFYIGVLTGAVLGAFWGVKNKTKKTPTK